MFVGEGISMDKTGKFQFLAQELLSTSLLNIFYILQFLKLIALTYCKLWNQSLAIAWAVETTCLLPILILKIQGSEKRSLPSVFWNKLLIFFFFKWLLTYQNSRKKPRYDNIKIIIMWADHPRCSNFDHRKLMGLMIIVVQKTTQNYYSFITIRVNSSWFKGSE